MDIRRLLVVCDTINSEGGLPAVRAVTRVAACAVITNPLAGVARDDLGELVPLGPFATWQAERAVGDHDRNTLRLRLDPQGDATGLESGMTVWLPR